MSVYKLVQTGRLPAAKIGHRWKIDPADLEAWIAAHRQSGRRWLLVGATDRTTERLREALGGAHELRCASFAGLREALGEAYDVIVIDTAVDRHAALAALNLCRSAGSASFAVLLVAETERQVLSDCLGQGLVTLMPAPPTPRAVEQIGAVLHWT